MGYSLKIGDAFIEAGDYGDVSIQARSVTLEDAPAEGAPTDYSNSRWPSYTGWRCFADAVGITPFMFRAEDGVMPSFEGKDVLPLIDAHPGVTAITRTHYKAILAAITEYQVSKNPHPYHLRRCDWLLFWLQWALANCTTPVFVNG